MLDNDYPDFILRDLLNEAPPKEKAAENEREPETTEEIKEVLDTASAIVGFLQDNDIPLWIAVPALANAWISVCGVTRMTPATFETLCNRESKAFAHIYQHLHESRA